MAKENKAVRSGFPLLRTRVANACCAIAVSMAASLQATTYWLDASVDYNGSPYPNPMTSAYYWLTTDGDTGTRAGESTSDALPSDGVFYLLGAAPNGDRIVRFRTKATYTFEELHVGQASSSRTGRILNYFGAQLGAAVNAITLNGTTYLENGGLLCNSYNNRQFAYSGDFVVASPDAAPFLMAAGYSGCTMNVAGSLASEVGCTLNVGGNNGMSGKVDPDNATYRFNADFSKYYGKFRLYNDDKTARSGDVVPQKLIFGVSTELPGTLQLDHDTLMGLPVAGTSLVVSDFSVGSNCKLALAANDAGTSCLTVTNSFSLAGPLEVALEVAYTGTVGVVRHRFLTLPIANGFNVEDVNCQVVPKNAATLFEESLSVVTNETEGTCSFEYACRYQPDGTVYLTSCDSTAKANKEESHYASALTNALKWSDGRAPESGKDYVLRIVNGDLCWLRTLQNNWTDGQGHTGADYTFPGDSLSVLRQGIVLCGERIRFNRLRLYDGATILIAGGSPRTRYVSGNVEVVSGAANLQAYWGEMIALEGAVSGGGDLRLEGVTSTSSPLGYYSFRNADMSAFKGRIIVSNHIGNDNPDFVSTNQTLYVWSEANFGGRLDEFDPAALTLERCGTLRALASFAVTTNCNRGITVSGAGRIQVDSGVMLDVKTPMAVTGLLRKNGAGVLRMAGALSAGTEDCVENVLELMAGTLRLAHAEAINGLSVEVGDGADVVLELDPSDADRAAAGVRMEKSQTPFVLAEGVDEIPLVLEVAGDAPEGASSFAHGLFTVANDAEVVASMRSMLPELGVQLYKGYRQQLVETEDAQAGTHTFAIQFVKRGLVIVVQ